MPPVYSEILPTKPPPLIKGYSLESVIAEKFETMLKLSIINSRMKDYYDIYILSQTRRFEGRILQEAIDQTFQRRGTAYERNPLIFQEGFINSIEKQREWNNYLGRIRSAPTTSFKKAVQQIIKFLVPVFESICNEKEFFFYWEPTVNKWVCRHWWIRDGG